MLLGGWLIFSTMTLIFMFGYFVSLFPKFYKNQILSIQYLQQILKVNNAALDWVTLGIVMWNFGIVGIICIHWKGPLFLQQCYLIISAALMALIFIKMLPNWTTWLILAFLSIWDLIAVLCPYGPLNMLLAQPSRTPYVTKKQATHTRLVFCMFKINVHGNLGASKKYK